MEPGPAIGALGIRLDYHAYGRAATLRLQLQHHGPETGDAQRGDGADNHRRKASDDEVREQDQGSGEPSGQNAIEPIASRLATATRKPFSRWRNRIRCWIEGAIRSTDETATHMSVAK